MANQQPASITDGLTALTATGTMKTDIEALVGAFEMSDTPTGDGTTSTGAELVSLFQCNAVAVAAMIEANWERQREAAVVLLEEIN